MSQNIASWQYFFKNRANKVKEKTEEGGGYFVAWYRELMQCTAIVIVILGILCQQVPPIVCLQERRNAHQLAQQTGPDNDSP